MATPLDLLGLSAALSRADSTIWGETVRDSQDKLTTLAVSGAKDHFTSQRAPDGTPWKPLAHPRPTGGNKVLRDKGLLAASISASVTEGELRLTASHPAANVHQFGATIRPKSARRLAIPLTRDAKRVPRPREFPRPLFVVGTVSATAYLAESLGKGRRARIVFHYALVKEVTVPARPFVGFSQETLSKMVRLLYETFTEKLFAAFESARAANYAANPIIA